MSIVALAEWIDRVGDWNRRLDQSLIGRAMTRGRHIDVAAHTLALAAQQVLCTAPLLVTVSMLMRKLHLGSVMPLMIRVLALDSNGATAVGDLFRTNSQLTLGDIIVQLLIAMLFLTSTAATTQRMLETVWGLDRSGWRDSWRQIAWVLAVSPSLAVAMWACRLVRNDHALVTAVLFAVVAGVASFLFYWWSQHFLLTGRVSWRRLIPASGLIGVGVALTVGTSAWWVPGQIAEQSSDYGAIGTAFVLSVWVMLITGVVVGGALGGAVLDERRQLQAERAASRLSPPLERTTS